MWVPLSFGNPEIPKNHPQHFWPGKAYVDWVGTTWYSPYRNSSAFHRFYSNRTWRSKPFAFAEWGVWGADVPGFVRPVLRLPEVPPARPDGGLLPVGHAQARVRARQPPGQSRRRAAGGQVASADGRGALEPGLEDTRGQGTRPGRRGQGGDEGVDDAAVELGAGAGRARARRRRRRARGGRTARRSSPRRRPRRPGCRASSGMSSPPGRRGSPCRPGARGGRAPSRAGPRTPGGQQARADLGMGADRVPLVGVQRPGLVMTRSDTPVLPTSCSTRDAQALDALGSRPSSRAISSA